ncbi:MAG: DegV family protein [Acidimicrobiales bacterium]
MAGVRIVTDSACDLPDDMVAAHGIGIVPLTIRFGEKEYVDRVELSAREFYEKMATSDRLPETAAPSPGAFEQEFTRMADEGATAIVCVNLSSDLSATMASAQNAAKAFSGGGVDVRVVDSHSITTGLGSQVLEAAKAAEAGRSVDEIVARVEDLAGRTHVFGALDTLENLKKGGRIGGAQAMLGTILSIKPIVDISTGVVEEAAKQRTRKKAMLWLRDKLFELPLVENLCVADGHAPDADEFLALILERYDRDQIMLGTIGATIGTHGGPRMLGLTWVDPAPG